MLGFSHICNCANSTLLNFPSPIAPFDATFESHLKEGWKGKSLAYFQDSFYLSLLPNSAFFTTYMIWILVEVAGQSTENHLN